MALKSPVGIFLGSFHSFNRISLKKNHCNNKVVNRVVNKVVNKVVSVL